MSFTCKNPSLECRPMLALRAVCGVASRNSGVEEEEEEDWKKREGDWEHSCVVSMISSRSNIPLQVLYLLLPLLLLLLDSPSVVVSER